MEREALMSRKLLLALAALVLPFAMLNAAEEAKAEGEMQRVLVYDSGSKPSVAAAGGKYEYRKISATCCGACEKCMKEVAAKKEGSKPAANIAGEKECVAYLCAHCGKLVWSENGKEVTKEAATEEEKEAVAKITTELKKKFDGTTKPSVSAREK
jgi:hypothetical protein